MRNLKYSASLFFLGWVVGAILGSVGYSVPAFLSWRFSLLELNTTTFKIILNNLAAAFITAFGAIGAARIFNLNKSNSQDVTFLYMIPTLILFLNGFSTGYFTSLLSSKFTPTLILLTIAPHGILEIPAIIISGAVGFTNIEELGKNGVQGRKYIPLIVVLIVAGGFIEGNVTSELPQIKDPIRILDLDAPSKAQAGVKFPVTLKIENSGIINKGYYIVLYSSSRDRIYEKAEIPPGESIIQKEMVISSIGKQNITTAIVDDNKLVTTRNHIIELSEPQISIKDVNVPLIYAGEDAVIEIIVENGDAVEREVDLVFQSSTGALSWKRLTLAPGEKLIYPYQTLIGQPGPRRFEISLHWNGVILSQKIVDSEVLGLRIKPKIISVNIPELRVNRTSVISIEIENVGSKGGECLVTRLRFRYATAHKTRE
jgi:hypothetical protein